MTIYLYIKTHRVTGLKYFGMTTKDDPVSYKGSGSYWKRHIKKHGYDVDTEIVGIFEDDEEASAFALQFSKDNNIVVSNTWANLMEETCKTGNPAYTKGTLGYKHTQETKEKIGKKHKDKIISEKQRELQSKKLKGRPKSEEHRRKIGEANSGKIRSKETCENISKARKGQPSSFKGKHHSEEALEKNAQAKRKTWVVTDPYGEEQTITNIIKFCNENNLSEDVMRKIARGEVKTHKGWKCSYSSSISI